MLSVGDMAPDFTLKSEQGEEVALSAFRGSNPVVLIFYPGDETLGCTVQLCAVRDGYKEFTDAGAVVFGVNPGDTQSHQKFVKHHNFQFRLLVDADKTVAEQYDALMGFGPFKMVNRTVYVVGADGAITFAQRGMPRNKTILEAIQAK